MPRPPRAETFDPAEVAIVHCVQRCVRRAFLAGVDAATGKNYEFRREWIRRRLELLASVFGIDVLAYAILSNHLHVVTRTRPDVVASWSDREVAIRWLRVFPGRRLDEQLAEPTSNDVDTLVNDKERLALIRSRLSDLSWFMRALSEPIARMANKFDECTGRFWEGRFKAQRITDEAGLLACSMYVDLNPVRAAMAATPEESVHTSAYDRIKALKGELIDSAAVDLAPHPQPLSPKRGEGSKSNRLPLSPSCLRGEGSDSTKLALSPSCLSGEGSKDVAEAGRKIRETPVKQLEAERIAKRKVGSGKRIPRDGWLATLTLDGRKASGVYANKLGVRASDKGFLPMSLKDYLMLLDWTGRQGRLDKRGKVPASLAPILQRIGIESSMWLDLVWNFKKYFGQSAGRPASLQSEAERSGRAWCRGQRLAAACFAEG